MKKEEFARLILGLRSAYPNFKIVEGKQAMDFWYMALNDISYDALSKAVYRYITTNKYPPSIADLRELIVEDIAEIKDWQEGWNLVISKIQKYGSNRKSDAIKEIKSIDPIAGKLAENNYITLCNSTNIVAERANFRELYKAEQEKQKGILQIPARLRNAKEKEMLNSYIALEGDKSEI